MERNRAQHPDTEENPPGNPGPSRCRPASELFAQPLGCGNSPRAPWLAASCSAVALMNAGDLSIEQWLPVLIDALAARYGSNAATAQKVTDEARRLERFLRACGATTWPQVTDGLISQWCWSARPDRSGRHRSAKPATARNRRWAAGAVIDTAAMLGAPVDTGVVGKHTAEPFHGQPTRPLTPDEEPILRAHAASVGLTLRAPLVPFAFAGGSAAEIAALTAADVDVDAGTVRFGGDAARTNPLDEWCRDIIGRYLRNVRPPPDEPLCVNARLEPERATHSVTVRLMQALSEAGLRGRAGLVATSIRLTTARRILEQHSIEAATRFLGSDSLDRTAQALGHDWRIGHG